MNLYLITTKKPDTIKPIFFQARPIGKKLIWYYFHTYYEHINKNKEIQNIFLSDSYFSAPDKKRYLNKRGDYDPNIAINDFVNIAPILLGALTAKDAQTNAQIIDTPNFFYHRQGQDLIVIYRCLTEQQLELNKRKDFLSALILDIMDGWSLIAPDVHLCVHDKDLGLKMDKYLSSEDLLNSTDESMDYLLRNPVCTFRESVSFIHQPGRKTFALLSDLSRLREEDLAGHLAQLFSKMDKKEQWGQILKKMKIQ